MKTSIRFTNTLFIVANVLLGVLLSSNKAIAQKEAEKIKNYLQANAAKHHLSANDIQEMTISKAYLSPTTGWYHVYYNQVYQSIEVYNGVLNTVLINDKVEHVANDFVENIAAKVPLGISTLQLSPLNAVSKAAFHLGLSYNSIYTQEKSVTQLANGQVSKAVYTNAGLSDAPIPVKLYWVLHNTTENKVTTTNMHLVWSVEIYAKNNENYWVAQVDAHSGNVLNVDDEVIKCNFGGPHEGHQHMQSQNVRSHTPFNQSRLAPLAPNSYRVFDYPIESPNHGARTIVTNPYTKFAPLGTGPGATNGWQEDSTTTYITTQGNNASAKIASNGVSPISATLDFDYPYMHGDTIGNRDAAITNVFYWSNLIHDILWKFGFDEPSGNYQKNNMGRGGFGNDPVTAFVQNAYTRNNATFAPGTDGSGGYMNLGLWNSGADSDFDGGIISHEYGHGWSKRLTVWGCLNNTEQAGEGWSDYLGLMLTTKWSTLTPSIASANMVRGMATYALDQPTNGNGIRHYPYSYDMDNVNSPVTYGKIAYYGVPHYTGSIWATVLWDMTWEIIFQDNQIVNEMSNTTQMVGNIAALKLVTEGLRLQKCRPSFVDARNGILKADSLLFNSRYSCAIWKAFARRGLGLNASTGESSNDRIVTEDFTPVLNNGWVFSSPTQAQTCSHAVFNYAATATGSGTATFSWARAAVPGIANLTKSGNSATINEVLINNTNSPITVTYKFYLSPSSCQAPIDIKVVVNPSPLATIATYEVCKDGTVPGGEGLVATSPFYTNTLNGTIASGAKYWRSKGDNTTTYTPAPVGIGDDVFYQTHTFTPTTSGPVSIEVVAGALTPGFPYDTYVSIYQTSFNPASPAVNFVAGDDDSGTLQYSSKITYNFTAGTTYILVVAPYYGSSTGTYRLQASASIFGGPNNWYLNSSGGSSLATGNLFNPVGVANSGIPNTATALAKTFYIENSIFACRTPATFIINPTSVGGSIAGSTTVCNDINTGQLTLSGNTGSILRWESSIDNFAHITVINDTTAGISYTNLTQTTQYRAIVKNRVCAAVNSAVATITRTNVTLPVMSNYALCQNSTVPTGAGLENPAQISFNYFNGALTTASPTYWRGKGGTPVYTPSPYTKTNAVYYQTHTFVAPSTETVTIETTAAPSSNFDTYMALYQTSFDPAAPATNFLVDDDDSGVNNYSKFTRDLTAGTTYIIVVAAYFNTEKGNFKILASSNLFKDNNTIKWYNYSAGGTALGSGNIFNPVGVEGAGIANTNTALTKVFYVESPDNPTCRVPTVFTINPITTTAVGGGIIGSVAVCSNTNSGTLNLSGHVGSILGWESSTDDFVTSTAVANTTTTLAYTNITQNTQYRVSIQNGICDFTYSHKAIIIRTNSTETATDYSTCQNAIVPVGQGLVHTNPGYTNKVSGKFVAGSPTYRHGEGYNLRTYTATTRDNATNTYYQTHTFTPTTSGPVTFEVVAAALTGTLPYDSFMSIYHTSFDPGSPNTNFLTDIDDGGTLRGASKFTETLTAGTTYILVVCAFLDKETGTYEVEASADVFGNPTNWYLNPTGGTVLGTGNIFNPVGVAGSGIPNMATVTAMSFYAGFQSFGTCLASATFTINTSYTPTLTGSTRCSPGTSVLTATGCTGGTVNWYTGISGGTAIATGTSYTTPAISTTTAYYADCTISTCVSERIPVVATIAATDATYSAAQTTGNYQVNQTITSSANVATGVNYFAGKAIILTPGFQAGGNEVFSAKIQDCQ